MKKTILAVLLAICLLFSQSCSFLKEILDAPLKNKMLKYYSNDKNYEEVVGKVISTEHGLLIEIIDGDGGFAEYEGKQHEFYICSSEKSLYSLFVEGDIIEVVSSSMIFYNGDDVSPIVELRFEGKVLLPFEEGKEYLIDSVYEFFRGY